MVAKEFIFHTVYVPILFLIYHLSTFKYVSAYTSKTTYKNKKY